MYFLTDPGPDGVGGGKVSRGTNPPTRRTRAAAAVPGLCPPTGTDCMGAMEEMDASIVYTFCRRNTI